VLRLSGSIDQFMAAVKRSPKRTANCNLAMDHSRRLGRLEVEFHS
jgi:hypothetical protein